MSRRADPRRPAGAGSEQAADRRPDTPNLPGPNLNPRPFPSPFRTGRGVPPPHGDPSSQLSLPGDLDLDLDDDDEDGEDEDEIGGEEDGRGRGQRHAHGHGHDPDTSELLGDSSIGLGEDGEADGDGLMDGEGDGDEDATLSENESKFTPLDPSVDPSCVTLKDLTPLSSITLSTSKPGCGLAALLANTPSSFWQSDGPQPHSLTLHFPRVVSLVRLYLYLDFELDESYTPTRIAVLSGMDEARLIEVREVLLESPAGWILLDLGSTGKRNALGESVLRTWCVQIQIRENCQNGKDTHIRGLKVYGRDEDASLTHGAIANGWPAGEAGAAAAERQREIERKGKIKKRRAEMVIDPAWADWDASLR